MTRRPLIKSKLSDIDRKGIPSLVSLLEGLTCSKSTSYCWWAQYSFHQEDVSLWLLGLVSRLMNPQPSFTPFIVVSWAKSQLDVLPMQLLDRERRQYLASFNLGHKTFMGLSSLAVGRYRPCLSAREGLTCYILVTSLCEEDIRKIDCLNNMSYRLTSSVCRVWFLWAATNSLSLWLNLSVDADDHAGGKN